MAPRCWVKCALCALKRGVQRATSCWLQAGHTTSCQLEPVLPARSCDLKLEQGVPAVASCGRLQDGLLLPASSCVQLQERWELPAAVAPKEAVARRSARDDLGEPPTAAPTPAVGCRGARSAWLADVLAVT